MEHRAPRDMDDAVGGRHIRRKYLVLISAYCCRNMDVFPSAVDVSKNGLLVIQNFTGVICYYLNLIFLFDVWWKSLCVLEHSACCEDESYYF